MTTENIETKKERNGMKKENRQLENKCISANIVYEAKSSCKQLRQEESSTLKFVKQVLNCVLQITKSHSPMW